ncbi:hypothetical protein ASC95_03410 [Pelomonas sp. Root1217]|uniref:PEP-CTERM sorting domain-containing protein n=1 Tax=Pelomonas sp. Root1217 TaxID=1736430 RepID=UPI00070D22FC|nr:PEP-CTERM sorting domain-containing protein [Pelomonas sp. Root1217]KQV60511.1 hypothetical protein ASC95_03410 [Pelomonas sp. Root1217]
MMKLLAAAALLPTLASASGLLDSTVNVHYHVVNGPQTENTLDKVMVTAGTELSCSGGANYCGVLSSAQSLDISDNAIRFSYGASGADFLDVKQNRFQFTSLYGDDTAIQGVTVATNISGLDASRVSFGAHELKVDMRGLHAGADAYFQINLVAAPVPEPASAALLLGGLALFAVRRGRLSRPR